SSTWRTVERMRCPVCKAENAQGPACRRCKADLSLLFAVEARRGWGRGGGRGAVGAGGGGEGGGDAGRGGGRMGVWETSRACGGGAGGGGGGRGGALQAGSARGRRNVAPSGSTTHRTLERPSLTPWTERLFSAAPLCCQLAPPWGPGSWAATPRSARRRSSGR